MELLHAVLSIFAERSAFFLQLMIEHLWISGAAIGIAIVLGGAAGILIHKYERAAAPTLGTELPLYDSVDFDARLSHSFLWHRQPFGNHRAHDLCTPADGTCDAYGTHTGSVLSP